MSYLLDTNVCIKLLNNSHEAVVRRLAKEEPKTINLCTIVKFELYFGAYRSKKTGDNIAKLKRFFKQFNLLNFDGKSAEIAGLIRTQLNKKGTPIGVYDLQIAAIALANNFVLVTHNISEFSRIDGLQYEDWES
ncbi:type II toxin-antitoxin system VapC family toxin [Spirulina sp. CS-785/01]|uniref:type II toxin-antitoxin system tRNA(fMet)-specific endonuclease VapC n=1 Tax=Spirulina sp. CS-785/01 TaxID=3021716 RepID=UPI0023309EF2|nr:type II toxin-antitoxin system VapC family toxin [Spirulina sp. CS-785/01]MDB9315715.1 type II toxin-antitoxin system VapC family toxin [Spirulina sp. CS-785/01]